MQSLKKCVLASGFQLFALGFFTLFLELVLIRYLAGNIWNLGYFPNLVLMAVFVGMGIGFIFHRSFSLKTSGHLFHLSFLLLFILIAFCNKASSTDAWL
ncbi:MAG: hypothetical protein COV44_00050 [Deltaproteobacteria bacterium CG11_big_fil_rev_8_21_14_0_20_45_16]|nr:MAG: hypothetical protein COV44_00050 [Deltaproteobacteria bacterium CG11_big_fil_rev_8_21_14_0_20_45_16]